MWKKNKAWPFTWRYSTAFFVLHFLLLWLFSFTVAIDLTAIMCSQRRYLRRISSMRTFSVTINTNVEQCCQTSMVHCKCSDKYITRLTLFVSFALVCCQFLVGLRFTVHRQCRSQVTLYWLLSTVHSKQQECSPDTSECTVDSEARHAAQPKSRCGQCYWSLCRRFRCVLLAQNRRHSCRDGWCAATICRRSGSVIVTVVPPVHHERGTPHHHDVTGQVLFTRRSSYIFGARVRRRSSALPDEHGQRVTGSRSTTDFTETCYRDATS